MGQFTSGFDSAFSTQTLIQGSTGFITMTHPFTFPDECRAFLHTDRETKQIQLPKHDLYVLEIEDMNDVVLNGASPAISLAQSRGHIETVLRLKESKE